MVPRRSPVDAVRPSDVRVLAVAILLLPAVVNLFELTAPLPQGAHPAREIAGYFQALALLRDGAGSYFYFTPDESMTALHLHSLLSAPLLALGWTEGGRAVSLAAMTGAAAAVAAIATQLLESRRLGVVAAGLFWVHPWVLAVATAYTPDALGVLLATLAVLAALAYVEHGAASWFALLSAATVLGAANHLWELSVALPVVAILLWDRSYRATVGYGAIAAAAGGLVVAVTSLQPTGTTHHVQYSAVSSPAALVAPATWLGHLSSPHPINVDVTLSVLLAMVATVFAAIMAWRRRRRVWVILACWLASAVVIPVALPVGYQAHLYYSWAVYAPLAVAGAAVLDRMRWSVPRVHLSATAVLLAVGYVLVFEVAVLSGVLASPLLAQATTPVVEQQSGLAFGETSAAADELAGYDAEPEDITFAGGWAAAARAGTDRVRYGNALGASQVLIYSGRLVRRRRLNTTTAPDIRPNASDCSVAVRRSGEHVAVHSC